MAPNGYCVPCRELLYLDLALENVVRAAAERGAVQSGAAAAAFVGPLLQNLALSGETAERVSTATLVCASQGRDAASTQQAERAACDSC